MASSAYAAVTAGDLGAYLKDVNLSANNTILTTLVSWASRVIDLKCGQYFYNDGSYVRYFDGEGVSHIDTGMHPFFAKVGTVGVLSQGAVSMAYTPGQFMATAPVNGDVFTLDVGNPKREQVTINGAVTGPVAGVYTCPITATTQSHVASTLATTFQIKLAYFENQPLAQWTTILDGDGMTPPTNYYFWPRNPQHVGAQGSTALYRPAEAVDIARIPIANTLYLPSSIPGYFTISITANWGWPAVPDVINDICNKMVVRAWRARGEGWAPTIGSPEIGVVHMREFWDPLDEAILASSDLKHIYL